MSDRLLVLLRHGESEWNLKNLFTGWTDVDLSPKGVEEAKEAGRRLKARGFRFERDFALDYYPRPAYARADARRIGADRLANSATRPSTNATTAIYAGSTRTTRARNRRPAGPSVAAEL